jgi:formylglycine-generating enzyme
VGAAFIVIGWGLPRVHACAGSVYDRAVLVAVDSSALLALLFGGASLVPQVGIGVSANADPGPSAACPSDMRVVDTVHYDDVEHLCIDWRPSVNRCFAYHPNFTAAHGPKHLRFCMDVFEAPNVAGKRATVMGTLPEAQAFCAARDKRLCSEFEWEAACEQGTEEPWQYGWSVDKKVCNSDKKWKPFDEKLLGAGGNTATKEADRLWQGSLAGEHPSCQTKDGIRDLMGNVEEWVTSSRRRRYPGALMGGFWAKPWTGCRGTNDAHDPSFFRFYEVGFRCCSEAQDAPASSAGPASPASP